MAVEHGDPAGQGKVETAGTAVRTPMKSRSFGLSCQAIALTDFMIRSLTFLMTFGGLLLIALFSYGQTQKPVATRARPSVSGGRVDSGLNLRAVVDEVTG